MPAIGLSMESLAADRVTPLREPQPSLLREPECTALDLIDEYLETYAGAGWPFSRAAALIHVREAVVAELLRPEAAVPEDAFEAWLIEKWLRQIRSPAFRASVQGQQLIAEWERG